MPSVTPADDDYWVGWVVGVADDDEADVDEAYVLSGVVVEPVEPSAEVVSLLVVSFEAVTFDEVPVVSTWEEEVDVFLATPNTSTINRHGNSASTKKVYYFIFINYYYT